MVRSSSYACALLAGALFGCADGGSPVAPAAPASARVAAGAGAGLVQVPTLQTSAEPAGVPGATRRFDITLRFVVPLSAGQRAAFNGAASRWEHVIIGDKPAITGTIPAGFCGLPGVPAFTGTIDDILIDVVVVPIDGPGGALAVSGPCAVRLSDELPAYGIMFFDAADVSDLEQIGLLNDVVTHEMAHVLGFGTLWSFGRSLLADAGGADPTFDGHGANVFFNVLHGGGPVPVENIGGPETADNHWRESVFGNELMTGFIAPGANPLSSVSTASMRDLGYTVAPLSEPYRLPVASASVRALTAAPGLNLTAGEQLIGPVGGIR